MVEKEFITVLVKGNPTIETLCYMAERGFFIVVEDGRISEIVPEMNV